MRVSSEGENEDAGEDDADNVGKVVVMRGRG